ncbi:AhpC/TSA family protein [Dongia mobilis]|uniref:AhpC/TSA family protein n=2 Tax=Dongia mobilis TaxID=578943 RepID=A0A4V3DEX6_9PROT|nr:AhpC/TSA family protein [Dongia mobilis]
MNQSKTTLSLAPAAPAKAPDQRLLVGDPAPMFVCRSNVNPAFDFSTAAGRYIVLSFLGSSAHTVGRPLFEAFRQAAQTFAEPDFYFFGVCGESPDIAPEELQHLPPGMDIFWDATGEVAARFRLVPAGGGSIAQPVTFLLDLGMRIVGIFATNDGRLQADSVLQVLRRLPRLGPPRPALLQAPVLVVPHVFERDLCRRLVEGYRTHGGSESGFMVERDGKTVRASDHRHKRRSDWIINDRELIEAAQERIRRRLVPEIARAFAFKVTRMERHIVACYDESGGYFRPHRDNTTKGTAHRRFAVTVNLNAEDYSGGDLMFPEFGRAAYRAPTGGAVVFSCSLLHEALPVTRGQRYAYLPFLYDEAAAAIRQANNPHLGDGVQVYQMVGATPGQATGPRPALAPQDRRPGQKAGKRPGGKGPGKDPGKGKSAGPRRPR